MRRTDSHVTLLVVLPALAALALAGCNSRASLPYDQSLCGNERLDPNEPCDYVKPGEYWQFNTDLCHNRPQYAGGPTHCTSSCEPNYEFCIDRAECNAFQASGCVNGKSCYFFPESHSTGCAAPGGRPPGDRCDDSSQCQPLSMCMENADRGKICSLVCDRNAPQCPGGTHCVAKADFPTPLGYCEHLALTCDPITNDRCEEPAACYFSYFGDPQIQCLAPLGEDYTEGQACVLSNHCMPTLTCIHDGCRVLCNLGAECAPGHTCSESLEFLNYGVCPQGKSCDPVTGDGCRGELACVFSNFPDGNRFCRHPGPLSEGTPCTTTGECGQGLFCSPITSMEWTPTCTPLCSGRKTCLNGKICALSSSDFLPGLCVLPSSCNVLENDCPTPFFCTIVNDLGDTACVNPGPAQPGEPCDLFRPCVAGQFCDNQGEGNRVCRHTCNLVNTISCPTGGICTDMHWDTGLPDVGVCK